MHSLRGWLKAFARPLDSFQGSLILYTCKIQLNFHPLSMQMTVIQFAKKVKKNRITIYNWIADHKMPEGVKVTQICGRIILEVDESFGNDKRPAS